MLKITALVLIFSAVAVQSAWIVQTGCNATSPISGTFAFVENGNCVKYSNSYYLIECDPANNVYFKYLCYDQKCSDCTEILVQSTGKCDNFGLTEMCFPNKIAYDKILPTILGGSPAFFGEISVDPDVENCKGAPRFMTIARPYTCIPSDGVDPHSGICDSDGTFTFLEWGSNDKECLKFPQKVYNGKSGECYTPSEKVASIRGCNIPLIGFTNKM